MEDNKFLLIFGTVLIAFLGLPIVMQTVRGEKAAPAAAGTAAVGVANPAQPAKEPPLLNEANLIGSEWEANIEGFPVKVSISAGGVAYAYHPMAKQMFGVESIEGRWQVNYDKVTLSMPMGGQTHEFKFEISGTRLFQTKSNVQAKLGEVKRLR